MVPLQDLVYDRYQQRKKMLSAFGLTPSLSNNRLTVDSWPFPDATDRAVEFLEDASVGFRAMAEEKFHYASVALSRCRQHRLIPATHSLLCLR